MSQTKFCPFCGVKNDLSQTTCINCNEALPVKLSAVASPAVSPRSQAGPAQMSYMGQTLNPTTNSTTSWWQSLSPALRSAVIMLFFNAGLQSLSSYLPGVGFIITAPFQVISYLGQGILVGKLAKEDYRYQTESYLHLGVQSVLWSTALSTLFLFLTLLMLGAVTLGGIIVLLPVMVVSQLGSIFLNVCFTMLGAWLYERNGGKNLMKISLIVGTVSFLGICGLVSGLAAVLAAVGYSLFTGGL